MSYTNGLDNPELYFQCKLYTGTGSSNAITLDGDEDMQSDFVWIKSRGVTYNNHTFNSVIGTDKSITANESAAEITISGLTAFGTDGFTVGTDNQCNNDGDSLVAWCWKESATAGFDIVSYTGNGSTRTVSHSLSAVPKVIICKSRGNTDGSTDAARNWGVYHAGIASDAETDVMTLDTDGAASDDNAPWNDTAPTSSVWSMGNDDRTNLSNLTYIAYLFAEKQGFSKFGSYTGNGNADGTFVYTGFKPAWVLVKKTSGDNWTLADNKRNGFNSDNDPLYPNLDNAEGNTNFIDLLSNGFKMLRTDGAENGSGATYIYMAFAENPFVTSTGIPTTAR